MDQDHGHSPPTPPPPPLQRLYLSTSSYPEMTAECGLVQSLRDEKEKTLMSEPKLNPGPGCGKIPCPTKEEDFLTDEVTWEIARINDQCLIRPWVHGRVSLPATIDGWNMKVEGK